MQPHAGLRVLSRPRCRQKQRLFLFPHRGVDLHSLVRGGDWQLFAVLVLTDDSQALVTVGLLGLGDCKEVFLAFELHRLVVLHHRKAVARNRVRLLRERGR